MGSGLGAGNTRGESLLHNAKEHRESKMIAIIIMRRFVLVEYDIAAILVFEEGKSPAELGTEAGGKI